MSYCAKKKLKNQRLFLHRSERKKKKGSYVAIILILFSDPLGVKLTGDSMRQNAERKKKQTTAIRKWISRGMISLFSFFSPLHLKVFFK